MSGKGGRGKISYVQQSEPSFIQAFKQRVGYKEGPSIDTKREELSLSDDDDKPEADDEKPVVVVLKSGDLTAEEAQRLQDEDEPPPDGKIKFRKPVKRNAEISSESAAKEIPEGDSKKRKKKKSTKEKSSSLLSFDEEENDDG